MTSIVRQEDVPPGYTDFIIRVLNDLESLFKTAYQACEFEFLWTLLGIRGMQDAGWNPYETTVNAISEVLSVCNKTDNLEAQKHLQLWLYLHIMEASEPYEILANLIGVIRGERFCVDNFPPRKNDWLWSPGEKIAEIGKRAEAVGVGQNISYLKELWDRDLRNSIGHATYVFYPNEIRTIKPTRVRRQLDVAKVVNGAIAYHFALQAVYDSYISMYDKPKTIDTHPKFTEAGPQESIVMVREGHGAIGLKDAWNNDELRQGNIPWRAARLAVTEKEIVRRDPLAVLFPSKGAQV